MATMTTGRQADVPSKAERERLTRRREDLLATGRKLRHRRLKAGLSPERLGYRIGVSGRTIRRIEKGEVVPIVSTMFALAEWAEEEVPDLWRL